MGLLKVCVNMECDSSGLNAVIHGLGYSGHVFRVRLCLLGLLTET